MKNLSWADNFSKWPYCEYEVVMKSLMHTMFCTIAITAKMVVACVLIFLLFSCLKTLGWDIAALWIGGGGTDWRFLHYCAQLDYAGFIFDNA